MQPTTNLIVSATRKSLKLLQRDFFEIEMMQGSKGDGLNKFFENSITRTKNQLSVELSKYFKSIFFLDDMKKIDFKSDNALLVQLIDSRENFTRSIPLFAMMITYIKKVNQTITTSSSIINFPMLNQIYYAEKGGGAWIEKNDLLSANSKIGRLRLNSGKDNRDLIVAGNDYDQSKLISGNIRHSGSLCFEMSLFLTNKIDALVVSGTNPFQIQGFELFTKEAGGTITSKNNNYIYSNFDIAGKLRQQDK